MRGRLTCCSILLCLLSIGVAAGSADAISGTPTVRHFKKNISDLQYLLDDFQLLKTTYNKSEMGNYTPTDIPCSQASKSSDDSFCLKALGKKVEKFCKSSKTLPEYPREMIRNKTNAIQKVLGNLEIATKSLTRFSRKPAKENRCPIRGRKLTTSLVETYMSMLCCLRVKVMWVDDELATLSEKQTIELNKCAMEAVKCGGKKGGEKKRRKGKRGKKEREERKRGKGKKSKPEKKGNRRRKQHRGSDRGKE